MPLFLLRYLLLRSPDDGHKGGGVGGTDKDYPPASQVDDDDDDDPADYVDDDDSDEDEVDDDDVTDDDSDDEEDTVSDSDDKGDDDNKGDDTQDDKGTDDKGDGNKGGRKPQSSEENHAQKIKRLEREAEEARIKAEKEKEEAIAQARNEAFKEALGGVNPFTGEKIENDDDLEEVRVMQEIKRRGGDPIADYAKYTKIFKQEERQRAVKKAAEEEERKKATQKEIADFHKDYPDVDLNQLLNDPTFRENTKDIIGKVPLSVAMKIHLEREDMKKFKAQQEQDESDARRGSSVGSVGTGQQSDDSLYSKEELARMSVEEIQKNWPKVQRSYAALQKPKK